MIDILQHPYCDNCPEFEPNVVTLYSDEITVRKCIECEHYERCKKIELYIRKELAEEVMEDDDIK